MSEPIHHPVSPSAVLTDGWHTLPCGGAVETRKGRPVTLSDGAGTWLKDDGTPGPGASVLALRLDVEVLTGFEISPQDAWTTVAHGTALKTRVFAWCSVCGCVDDARRIVWKCQGRFGHKVASLPTSQAVVTRNTSRLFSARAAS